MARVVGFFSAFLLFASWNVFDASSTIKSAVIAQFFFTMDDTTADKITCDIQYNRKSSGHLLSNRPHQFSFVSHD